MENLIIENKYLYFVDTYNCEIILKRDLAKFNLILKFRKHEFYVNKLDIKDIIELISKNLKLNFKEELEDYRNYLIENGN